MPTFADQAGLDQALTEFNQGKYNKAAKIWKQLAEQGEAQAQYSLAVIYHRGLGRSANAKKAVSYYRLAAEQGHLNSMFNLGIAHWEGRGADQDSAQAVQWWRKAANLGFAPAQFNLGTAYYLGQGVGQNSADALLWLQRSAANGSQQATQSLSMLKLKHPRLIAESEQAYRRQPKPASRVEPKQIAVQSLAPVSAPSLPGQIQVYADRSLSLAPFDIISHVSLVDVVEDHGEWLRVRNRDQYTVWVYGQYVSVDEGLGLITGGKVRLRPFPSTGAEAPAIDTLERGTQVEVLETRRFWKKIIAPLAVRAWIRAADLGGSSSSATTAQQSAAPLPQQQTASAGTNKAVGVYAVHGGGGLRPFTQIAMDSDIEVILDRGE